MNILLTLIAVLFVFLLGGFLWFVGALYVNLLVDLLITGPKELDVILIGAAISSLLVFILIRCLTVRIFTKQAKAGLIIGGLLGLAASAYQLNYTYNIRSYAIVSYRIYFASSLMFFVLILSGLFLKQHEQ